MNKQLAFRVGRIIGKIEEKLYRVPFQAESLDITLGGMITELEEGFGDNSDMIEIAEAMRGYLDTDDSSNSNKERVRKGYFALVAEAEDKLKEE